MILFTFKRRLRLLFTLLSFIAVGGVHVHAEENLIKGVEFCPVLIQWLILIG